MSKLLRGSLNRTPNITAAAMKFPPARAPFAFRTCASTAHRPPLGASRRPRRTRRGRYTAIGARPSTLSTVRGCVVRRGAIEHATRYASCTSSRRLTRRVDDCAFLRRLTTWIARTTSYYIRIHATDMPLRLTHSECTQTASSYELVTLYMRAWTHGDRPSCAGYSTATRRARASAGCHRTSGRTQWPLSTLAPSCSVELSSCRVAPRHPASARELGRQTPVRFHGHAAVGEQTLHEIPLRVAASPALVGAEAVLVLVASGWPNVRRGSRRDIWRDSRRWWITVHIVDAEAAETATQTPAAPPAPASSTLD